MTTAVIDQKPPLEQIRSRLWNLADELVPMANAADASGKISSFDLYRIGITRKMRMWALNVVAGMSDNFTSMADDGSLMSRVIGGFRDQFGPDADEIVPDPDLLYELGREVSDALRKVEDDELFSEGVPVWASARAALQALQQATLMPESEDIRALAMQFSLVPEYMALSAAYSVISQGNEMEGGDEDDLTYFIGRETDPRVSEAIENVRKGFGARWLEDLNLRLTTDVAEEFEPPTGPSPGYNRTR